MNEIAPGAEVRGLACGHMFHFECLGAWFMKDANMEMCCPLCRKKITEQKKIEMEGLRGSDVSHFNASLPDPAAPKAEPPAYMRGSGSVKRQPNYKDNQMLEERWGTGLAANSATVNASSSPASRS